MSEKQEKAIQKRINELLVEEYEPGNAFDLHMQEDGDEPIDALTLTAMLRMDDKRYHLTTTPTGVRLVRVDDYVFEYDEDGLYDPKGNVYEFLADVDDEDILRYYGDVWKQFNDDFWQSPPPLLHGTTDIDSVMTEGLEGRSDSRGISNRSVGAAVFTTTEMQVAEDYAYGSDGGIVRIDTAAMKRDGYMPFVGEEPPITDYEYRVGLAHALEVEDWYPDEESGIDRETVIVYGSIPAKYLTRIESNPTRSPAKPTVSAVIIRKAGKVLLLKRSALVGHPGKWNLPMGHIEPGETQKQAAVRETREESSLRVSGLRHVKNVLHGRTTVAYFEAARFTGRPKIDFESSDWAWVSMSELPKYDCLPGLKRVLAAENPTMSDKQQDAFYAVLGHVQAAKFTPSNLKTAQAKKLLTTYFEELGYKLDRYGNLLHPTKKDERVHFSKVRVQWQFKSYGTWRNYKTGSPVEVATEIIIKAATSKGDQKTVDLWTKKVAARKQSKAKAATRAKKKAQTYSASILAFKHMAYEEPRVMALAGHGVKLLDQDVVQGLKTKRDKLVEQYDKLLDEGGEVPSDSSFASADRPPVLPLFYEPISYTWVETVGGHDYTVHVKHAAKDVAVVTIGSAGSLGMTVNPRTHRIEQAMFDAKGDAQISGQVAFNGETFLASLFMITSKDKQKGAGTRVMSIWCRMMAGYGIEAFRGEAVGTEGAAFIKALQAKGKLEVLSVSGSNVLVQCT